MAAESPERRAPAGGQLGPAVVAVLRLQKVAGEPEIEPFFRRDASPVRVRVQQRLDVRRDHELRLEQAVHELGRQAGIDDFLIPDGDGQFAVPAEHRHGVAFQRVEEGIGGVAEALARFGLGRVEQGKLAHGAAFSGIHRFRSVVLHGHASVADERGEFALKRAELEFAEQGGGFLPVHRAHAHGVEREGGAAAGVQRGELAVQEHGFELAVEFFLQGGLHGGEAVPDGFQRGVLVEQLFRRLRPHAADAGDVVAGVADDRLHVRPLRGPEARFFLEALEGDDFFVPAGRVPHHDVVMQALLEVLVGSHEDHRAFLAVALGKRGEAVVRLAAVGDFEVQAERLDEPMDGIDLLDEVFRGGAALRLVEREKLMPEVGAVSVEHEGEMLGLFLAEDAHEDAGHDEQRARRESVRTLHTLVGVESPVYEGRSVHKIDRLLFKSLLDAHSFSKRATGDFPRTG